MAIADPDDVTIDYETCRILYQARPARFVKPLDRSGKATIAAGTRVEADPAPNGWDVLGVYIIVDAADPGSIGAMVDRKYLHFLTPLELLAETAE